MLNRDHRRPNPLVFLSSTVWGLRDERRQLFDFGQTFGPYAVWVDEHREQLPDRKNSGHERWAFPDINPWDDIDDYLAELKRSKLLVVLTGTERVGSPIQTESGASALATFFEMELAYAAALGRPVALVSVVGVEPKPKLRYLIDLLERIVAVRHVSVAAPQDIVPAVREIIEDVAAGEYDDVRRRLCNTERSSRTAGEPRKETSTGWQRPGRSLTIIPFQTLR